VLLAVAVVSAAAAAGQQTIFNVPSGDILDKARVYGEIDFAYLWNASAGTYTPRVVAGIGHQIEIGMNLNGISTPTPLQTTPTPTIKWRAYNRNGLGLLLGDDLYLPVRNKTYEIGNYFYAELTKTFRSRTRLTMGAYDSTSHVFASSNRAGGQFGIEQPINKPLTLAADWFTGSHSAGYLTPGAAIKLGSKATAFFGYEIGNSGLSRGNHLLLTELGWNFN